MPTVVDLGNDERKQRVIQMLLQWMQQKDQRGLIEAQTRYTDANKGLVDANTRDTNVQADARQQKMTSDQMFNDILLGKDSRQGAGTGRPFDMAIDGRVDAPPYQSPSPAPSSSGMSEPERRAALFQRASGGAMPKDIVNSVGLATAQGPYREGFELSSGAIQDANQRVVSAETNRHNVSTEGETRRSNLANEGIKRPVAEATAAERRAAAGKAVAQTGESTARTAEIQDRMTPGGGYEQIRIKIAQAGRSGKVQLNPQQMARLRQIEGQTKTASANVKMYGAKVLDTSGKTDVKAAQVSLEAAKQQEAELVKQANDIINEGLTISNTGSDADAELDARIMAELGLNQ